MNRRADKRHPCFTPRSTAMSLVMKLFTENRRFLNRRKTLGSESTVFTAFLSRETERFLKNFFVQKFLDGALGILTKGILGHRELLLRPSMDPDLSYQILVTGFAKERDEVQSCAVVSYHSGGKPGLSY